MFLFRILGNISGSVRMETLKSLKPSLSGDLKTYPFICGICSLMFDDLSLFLRHFRTHSEYSLPKSNVHACSCLYQDEGTIDDSRINESYKCSCCMKVFFSICKIHNHVVNCPESNGSYILDNMNKMVYPLSLHCSDFESRENNKCDSIDDNYHVDLRENNKNHKALKVNQREIYNTSSKNSLNHSDTDIHVDTLTNGLSADNRFSSEHYIDHILKYVSQMFEKKDVEKKLKNDSMDINMVEKKKVSPKKRKVKTHNKSKKTKADKVKRRKNQMIIKKAKISKEGESKVIQLEANNGNVVKETQLSKEHSDKKSFVKTEDVSVGSDQNNKDFNDYDDNDENDNDENGDDENGDDLFADYDDDDLTDEYSSAEDLNNKDNLQKRKKQGLRDSSLKLTNNRNEVNHQKTNNRSKTLQKRIGNIYPKEKGCLQKSAEECPYCGKLLKPYKMKIHLVSHTEARPFQCDLCPKSYKYHGHLETHKASHQDVKPYYCEICGKGYITITRLKHHSMMHHTDSKPCVCNICGASFIVNSKLKRHMTKHTGEKSVQCDLCGMGFSTRYNLNIHIQGVHKKDHRFTCTECGKNFMTNYQLKVHRMKHSGERPYKCVICKAEYIERKELRRHLKKQHNMKLEENTNTLTVLMEGNDTSTSKLTSTRETTYSDITNQKETSSAANYILAGNEHLYSDTSTDITMSTPYQSTVKKTLAPSEYQMIYTNTQEYIYDNSSAALTLPLTVQEIQE